MNKIFCFGDGFAAGHIWPEWPQILSAMYPDFETIIKAAVGAGPEWLVHQLVKNLDQIQENTVVFQWPDSKRFDKLVEDSNWQTRADLDPVYSFNQYQDLDEHWWITSNSQDSMVLKYHQEFVQQRQHKSRLNDYQALVKTALSNIVYIDISTEQQQTYSKEKIFAEIRQSEIQPSPPVHFYYIVDYILPAMSVLPDADRLQKLKQRILSQKWQAYDPDRQEIWADLINF